MTRSIQAVSSGRDSDSLSNGITIDKSIFIVVGYFLSSSILAGEGSVAI